jgi:hypothetical protein
LPVYILYHGLSDEAALKLGRRSILAATYRDAYSGCFTALVGALIHEHSPALLQYAGSRKLNIRLRIVGCRRDGVYLHF